MAPSGRVINVYVYVKGKYKNGVKDGIGDTTKLDGSAHRERRKTANKKDEEVETAKKEVMFNLTGE